MSVQGGPGCDTSGDDLNLPPWDIGDCVEQDGEFSQMPPGDDDENVDPTSCNDRKRNLAAGRGIGQRDSAIAHLNLPPDNRYEVTLRIGPAGDQTAALASFAATFTGSRTSFEVDDDHHDGIRRLIAGGIGDARPGFPPGQEARYAPADPDFSTVFGGLEADGRSPRPWADGGAPPSSVDDISLPAKAGPDDRNCDREDAEPITAHARSQVLERNQLNATFFLAEGFDDVPHIPTQLRGLVVETDANDFNTQLFQSNGNPFRQLGLPLPSWNPRTGELSLQLCNPHHAPLNIQTLARLIAFEDEQGGERATLWPAHVRPVNSAGALIDDLTWAGVQAATPTTGTNATHVGSPRAAAWDAAGIDDFVNVGYYRVRLTPAIRGAMGLGSVAQLVDRADVRVSTDASFQRDIRQVGSDVLIDVSGFTYSAPEIAVARQLPATWPLMPTVAAGDEMVVFHAAEGLDWPELPDLRVSRGNQHVQTHIPSTYAPCVQGIDDGRARIELQLAGDLPGAEYQLSPLDSSGNALEGAEATFTVAGDGTGEVPDTVATCVPSDGPGTSQPPASGGAPVAEDTVPITEVTPLPDETRCIEAEVTPGATVDLGTGPLSPQQPVGLALTSGATGQVSVGVAPATGTTAGFSLIGTSFRISAPDAAADRPHELVLRVSTEAIGGDRPVAVLRDGEVVRRCSSTDGRADPDPCVRAQTTADGELTLRVLTSRASTWAVGALDVSGLSAVCPTIGAPYFGDITLGSTHAQAIACLSSREVISGRTAERFEPRATLSRAQAATIVAGLLEAVGVDLPEASSIYLDVRPGSTHAAAIAQLTELGIVRGRDDTRFDPAGELTRAQLATLVVGAMEHVQGAPLPDRELPFDDVPPGSAHARSIARLESTGIVRGTTATTYEPGSTVTREQAASMLARLLNRLVAERSLE